MEQKKELLKIEELSEKLSHSPRTIRRWVKRGLPAYMPGRCFLFDWDEVVAWIKENRQ
jgi:excisionase family DNA binding protein